MALYGMSVVEKLMTLLWHVCGANNIPVKNLSTALTYEQYYASEKFKSYCELLTLHKCIATT